LVNVEAGSPSARVRQPMAAAKLNFLSLSRFAEPPEAGFSLFYFPCLILIYLLSLY